MQHLSGRIRRIVRSQKNVGGRNFLRLAGRFMGTSAPKFSTCSDDNVEGMSGVQIRPGASALTRIPADSALQGFATDVFAADIAADCDAPPLFLFDHFLGFFGVAMFVQIHDSDVGPSRAKFAATARPIPPSPPLIQRHFIQTAPAASSRFPDRAAAFDVVGVWFAPAWLLLVLCCSAIGLPIEAEAGSDAKSPVTVMIRTRRGFSSRLSRARGPCLF